MNIFYLYDFWLHFLVNRELVLFGISVVFKMISFIFIIKKWYIQSICLFLWGCVIITRFIDYLGDMMYVIILYIVIVTCFYLNEKNKKITFHLLE